MDDNSQEFSLNAVYPNPNECESLMTDTSITLTSGYNSNVKLSKSNTRSSESLSMEDINLNRTSIICGKSFIKLAKFHDYVKFVALKFLVLRIN